MSFTKVLVGCLAAGALAVPPAAADEAEFNCGSGSLRVAATADTYDVAAYGYVVHAADRAATIRCYVEVDGVEVSSTPTGTGVTAAPVSFSAGQSSVVRLCAAVTDAHGPTVWCDTWTTQPIPPDEVRTLLDWVIVTFVGSWPCDYLRVLPGDYGVIVIGSDGDVYVDGEPEWDCPPYQHFPPA